MNDAVGIRGVTQRRLQGQPRHAVMTWWAGVACDGSLVGDLFMNDGPVENDGAVY